MGLFEKGINAFADMGNALNKGINKAVGKDIFGEIKKVEKPKEFPPYESYSKYPVPAPAQWQQYTGSAKQFSLQGNVIRVSKNLDICIQYVSDFKSAAQYYTDRFIFMYRQCVTDFDAFLYYFQSMYLEGMNAMLDRAYSLFLLFGIFNVNKADFQKYHLGTYNLAVRDYSKLLEIVENKKQNANQLGNMVGNSVKMRGGGFGMTNALKGMAQAEAFNMGMNLLGKYVENQAQMSSQEKETVFANLKTDVFFQEVYTDYFNTFYSLIDCLAKAKAIENISTRPDEQFNTVIANLQNPMFPQEQVASLLANLVSIYPFAKVCYDVMKQRFGETSEVAQISQYFAV